MLNKLALRNAKRSMSDYVIYLLTMIAVSAMMFAFNSLIFSKDIQSMCSEAAVLAALLGVATFFIVIIVAWLINYMAKFMLEKRSREFATYLLIGLKKKALSRLYMKENLLIGTIALFIGIVLGTLLQQVIMTIFYSVFSEEYKLHIQMSIGCMVMTFCCYYACYLLALLRNKRMFKKMSIAELLQMEKNNDELKLGHEKLRQCLFFFAIVYMIFVYVVKGKVSSLGTSLLLIIGFIAAIYIMFFGLSAFIICRVEKKGKKIYQNNRMFLYRQYASKVRTMRFTMGTLTILLIGSIFGTSFSLMFAKHQSQVVDYSIPFDVIVHSPMKEDDFLEEISSIESYNKIQSQKVYRIYENGSQLINRYFSTHISSVIEEHIDKNGNFVPGMEYYRYDTYMKLSDYNALRGMLGKEAITLGENQYALQTKTRIVRDLDEDIYTQQIEMGNHSLSLSKIYTEAFSQNGINGADYLIIVPDNVSREMRIYYSVYAADIEGEGTAELKKELDEVYRHKHGMLTQEEYDVAVENETIKEEEWKEDLLETYGTDEILVIMDDFFVRDIDSHDFKFAITALNLSLAYIALIFVFVALTILSVQQLSDGSKYKFRYDVLKKLGMKRREVDKLIFQQLALYYLVPAIVAIVISSVIVINAGNEFVRYTGARGNGIYYFGMATAITLGIYVLYFLATYVGFKRNVNE